ncbi:hypothetical protein ACSBR1_016187 [Camellia fascicularis]
MNQLRFLSLRGISMITVLPSFILQLTNLKILDLKACHNLEMVPNGIGLLKSLTHLDMSECYFLDHMPKTLGSLLQLEVLKGFVIGHSTDKKSCTIHDLIKLSKLRKLSIYTSSKEFPTNKQQPTNEQSRTPNRSTPKTLEKQQTVVVATKEPKPPTLQSKPNIIGRPYQPQQQQQPYMQQPLYTTSAQATNLCHHSKRELIEPRNHPNHSPPF